MAHGVEAMIRAGYAITVFLTLLTLSGCRRASRQARTTNLEAGEVLAFSHWDPPAGLPDIYLIDRANGVRAIAASPRYDTSPLWSPDGSQLIYQRSYGWETDFFLIDAQGKESRQLTADGFYKYAPRWSPDGRSFSYINTGSSGTPARQPVYLTVLDLTSGDTRSIPFEGILDYQWRPTEDAIVAVTLTGTRTALEQVSMDGSRMILNPGTGFLDGAIAISLSPDASLVAYARKDPNQGSLADPLYISTIENDQEKSVGSFATDSSLAWSPDSTRLAYTTLDVDYQYVLYVVNADGSGMKELLVLNTGDDSGEILPGTPAWSADSRKIAIGSFSSSLGSALYVLNADGSGTRLVTEPGGLIYDVSWKPAGE